MQLEEAKRVAKDLLGKCPQGSAMRTYLNLVSACDFWSHVVTLCHTCHPCHMLSFFVTRCHPSQPVPQVFTRLLQIMAKFPDETVDDNSFAYEDAHFKVNAAGDADMTQASLAKLHARVMTASTQRVSCVHRVLSRVVMLVNLLHTQ